MPTIEILASAAGPAVRVTAAGRLVDVCDEARAPVELSCRAASCGTCLLTVLEGADLLDPPRAEEAATLHRLAAPPGRRLACQVAVRPGVGLVRLRWAGGGV